MQGIRLTRVLSSITDDDDEPNVLQLQAVNPMTNSPLILTPAAPKTECTTITIPASTIVTPAHGAGAGKPLTIVLPAAAAAPGAAANARQQRLIVSSAAATAVTTVCRRNRFRHYFIRSNLRQSGHTMYVTLIRSRTGS